MAKVMFKGFEIRPSGKHFFKIYKDGVSVARMRARSVEAAQAMINSTGRVMTRKEHALVHGSDPNREPTAQQAESERRVIVGECEGFVQDETETHEIALKNHLEAAFSEVFW